MMDGEKTASGKKRKNVKPKNNTSNASKPSEDCPLKKETKELNVMDEESGKFRHYDKSTSLLEVVQTDKSDEVTVHYIGPNPKPKIELAIDGKTKDPIQGADKSGGKVYKIPVTYIPREAPYGKNFVFNKLDTLFTKKHPPTIYSVEGINQRITIKAYNPDQWKLSIKLPPFKGMSLGARMENSTTVQKLAGNAGTKTIEKQVLVIDKKDTSWRSVNSSTLTSSYESYCSQFNDASPYQVSGSSLKVENDVKPTKTTPFLAAINLSHNGRGVSNELDVLNGIINFVTTFTAVIKAFKNLTPSVGWYIDFDLKVFQGTFELAWGWREQTDHLAYYYVGACADLTIVQIMFEIGFGVSVGGIKAQICVQFKGGLGLKLGIETRPTAPSSATLGEFKGNISAGGYIRCGVGDLVKLEAGIVTGITITLTVDSVIGVSASSQIELNTATKWDGLSVVASFSTILGFSRKKTFKLIDEKQLSKKNLLGGKEETPPTEYRSVLEVESVAVKTLKEGLSLQVYHVDQQGRKGVKLKSPEVAERIAAKVWTHKTTISLTETSVEGLMHGVRADLDRVAKGRVAKKKFLARDWLCLEQLDEYLNSAPFNERLKNAKDVVKAFQADVNKDPQP
jgi:hypothetical protein